MRIARQISTGKILEMQSHATPGTLIANAVGAGHAEADVEEIEMTEVEYRAARLDAEWGADLASAKARRVREIKKEARALLREHSDWAVIRVAEPAGMVIPEAVRTYIDAVRSASKDAETAINTLTTVSAVRDYKPAWPQAPQD